MARKLMARKTPPLVG
nr:agno [Squirrel monkey polyomavirus]